MLYIHIDSFIKKLDWMNKLFCRLTACLVLGELCSILRGPQIGSIRKCIATHSLLNLVYINNGP